MLVTKQKTIEKILEIVKDYNKIFLLGCGECAATCKTGGEPELEAMKEKLKKAGKTVTGLAVPEASCIASKVKLAFGKNRKALENTEAILVFSCGSAVASAKENDRVGLEVVPGCDTLFGAIVDAQGNFIEKCSACGECVLDETAGICPVTRCPKGILNGPCGGVKQGKCEVDIERDCAWVLIYKQLKEKGKLDKFLKPSPAKDYSKMNKPRQLSLNSQ